MAKIPKPVRYDEELVNLIEERGKGSNFAEKIHNTLYYHYKHEEEIRDRIEVLEETEIQIKKEIKGLKETREITGNLFRTVADLLDSISSCNKYGINNNLKRIQKMVNLIMESM